MNDQLLLEVKSLTKDFPVGGSLLSRITGSTPVMRAVNDLNFRIHRGEVVGLVGESGCGKSMTAFSILRLIPQFAVQLAFQFPFGTVVAIAEVSDHQIVPLAPA